MSDKKDDVSLVTSFTFFYLCALGIGSVLGTVVFFGYITFIALNEAAAFLRKLGGAVWQVLT